MKTPEPFFFHSCEILSLSKKFDAYNQNLLPRFHIKIFSMKFAVYAQ